MLTRYRNHTNRDRCRAHRRAISIDCSTRHSDSSQRHHDVLQGEPPPQETQGSWYVILTSLHSNKILTNSRKTATRSPHAARCSRLPPLRPHQRANDHDLRDRVQTQQRQLHERACKPLRGRHSPTTIHRTNRYSRSFRARLCATLCSQFPGNAAPSR